jgi:hypothetical protein
MNVASLLMCVNGDAKEINLIFSSALKVHDEMQIVLLFLDWV